MHELLIEQDMSAPPQVEHRTGNQRLQQRLHIENWIRTKYDQGQHFWSSQTKYNEGTVAYVLPTYNLTCNIYDWVPHGDPLGAPRVTSECNNALGRRVQVSSTGGTGDPEYPGITLTVLLPALTDVRGTPCYGDYNKGDILETPAGSGRIYLVVGVEDAGKGFSNEHRVAYCFPTFYWGNWPAPIP